MKFLIENWSAVSAQIPDPTITVVDAKTMLEIALDAEREKQQVRIFELTVGPCIHDTCKGLV